MRSGEGVEDANRKPSERVLITGIDDSRPEREEGNLFGKMGEDMNPDGRANQGSEVSQVMETDGNCSQENPSQLIQLLTPPW